MVKKVSTLSLLTKMNVRTFLRSRFQFLAVIFISAIAMTLYVGLTSNAKSINNRVNQLYEEGNIADIWLTLNNSDMSFELLSENDNENKSTDIEKIREIVGDNGVVEERFTISSDLNSYTSNALLYDYIPTINCPANTDNKEQNDFLIMDYRLLETQDNNSTTIIWKDYEGNYLQVPVNFSISNYQLALSEMKVFNDFTAMDILNALTNTNEGKKNIFDSAYLNMQFQITGSAEFAENVQSSLINSSNFVLSKKLFLKTLDQMIEENYVIPYPTTSDDPLFELKTLLQLASNSGIDIIQAVQNNIHNLFSSNQYVIKLNDSSKTSIVMDKIQNYFASKGKENNLLLSLSVDNQPFNVIVQNDIVQAEQLAYIFPIVFFLVAILVVLTTVSQLIIKDQIQIGTLKALGLSNAQIIIHYMSLASFVILIGIVLGIVLGPFILPLIMNQKYAILYSLPAMAYTISIPEALISSILTILATILVTYLVIRQRVKLNPSQSMNGIIVKTIKPPKKDYIKSSKAIPFKMAFRNIRLNITKSLMVIIGIMGCSALLVCGFGIDDTLQNGINVDVKHFFAADGFVFYSNTSSHKDELLSIEGIDKAEEYTNLPTNITFNDKSYDSYVYVLEDNSSFFKLDDFELKDKIVVSNKVANQLGLSIGDKIDFSSIGFNFKGEVGYILEVFYMHGIYINSTYNDYNTLFNIKTNAWISFSQNETSNQIINDVVSINGISGCRTKQESIDIINNYMSSIQLMTLAVKVFAILLAVVVLYNLCLLNYKERARDIATLKVLGFSRLEIANSLLIESMTLTIIGVTLGMFLGLPMEILVLIVNLTPLVEFLYVVYPLSYVLSILITIGTALLVNALLTYKIKKIQMVESLKSIE